MNPNEKTRSLSVDQNKLTSNIQMAFMQNRGKLEADEFLSLWSKLLLYRFLSEKMSDFANQKLSRNEKDQKAKYPDLSDQEAEAIKDEAVKEIGFFILPGNLYENKVPQLKNEEQLLPELQKILTSIDETVQEGPFSKVYKDLLPLSILETEKRDDLKRYDQATRQILDSLENLNSSLSNDKNLYGKAYDQLLEIYDKNAGKFAGQLYTSLDLSQLLASLALQDQQEINSLYDPAIGTATSLLAVYSQLNNKQDLEVFGQDISQKAANLSSYNLIFHSVSPDRIHIASGDTLTNPSFDKQKFDLIISSLPFGMRWPGENKKELLQDPRFALAGKLAPKTRADLAFVLHALSSLSENGTAILLCSPGILYREGAEQEIRKYLIEQEYIDAIIQLPTNTLSGTAIAPCVLILKKNRPQSDILFINALNEESAKTKKNQSGRLKETIEKVTDLYRQRENREGISKLVDLKTLKDESFNLEVSHYLSPSIEEEFEKSAPLKELVYSIRIGSIRNEGRLEKEEEKIERIPALVIDKKSLSQELLNDPEDFKEAFVKKVNHQVRLNNILLSRNFSDLKASIFNIEDCAAPVEAVSNLFVIQVNEHKIYPYYLLAFLNSEKFKESLKGRMSLNMRMISFSTPSLEKIQIPLFPMDMQKVIGDQYKELITKKSQLKKELDSIVEQSASLFSNLAEFEN